jgi:HK97 family phage major capsid protein
VTAPTIIPTTASELEEMLGDSSRMQRVFANKASFGEFIQNYARTVMNRDETIATQVREETQRVLRDMLKDSKGAANPLLNPIDDRLPSLRRGNVYNKRAPGVALDGEFRDQAEFFQSIWHKANALRNWGELEGKRNRAAEVLNSFGSAVPDAGGFLVPEILRSELLAVALEKSIVRSRATTISMDSLRVPIPTVDDTSHVSSVFGGMTYYWAEEGASLTDTQASFGRVVLEAKKLTGYAEVPNELVADAPAFQDFFSQKFPQGLAYFEDVAFLNGSGVGEPEGLLNAACAIQVAKESGQSAGTIVWENLVKMYARMLPTSLSNAVWIASIDTFPQLATMSLSVGTGGSAIWLGHYANPGDQAPPVSILGRPVIFTEKTPPLGTPGDINLVDLSYYLLGDRQVMTAESSPHYKFQQDKTAFRIIERVDGRNWLRSAITPHNNSSNTLSPVVQIAAR